MRRHGGPIPKNAQTFTVKINYLVTQLFLGLPLPPIVSALNKVLNETPLWPLGFLVPFGIDYNFEGIIISFKILFSNGGGI